MFSAGISVRRDEIDTDLGQSAYTQAIQVLTEYAKQGGLPNVKRISIRYEGDTIDRVDDQGLGEVMLTAAPVSILTHFTLVQSQLSTR